MVVGVRDEAVPGLGDQFAMEQEVGGEAADVLKNKILYEASHCVRPLFGGLLHFVSVQ